MYTGALIRTMVSTESIVAGVLSRIAAEQAAVHVGESEPILPTAPDEYSWVYCPRCDQPELMIQPVEAEFCSDCGWS